MPEPSAVRRQLGSELTAVRLAAGLDQRTLAQGIGISQKSVSRFERGERIPDGLHVVQAWLDACRPRPRGYPAGVQNRIRALYRAAAGETRSWTELLKGSHLQDVARERLRRGPTAGGPVAGACETVTQDEHGTIHSVALQGILSAWAPGGP